MTASNDDRGPKGRANKNRMLKLQVFFWSALAFLSLTTSCTMIGDMQALKTPRYESGPQKGAGYCGGCHKDIYDQWANNSRHAVANTSGTFIGMRDKFENDLMLNTMMGVSMCYSCHGKRDTNEGVGCETCHGTAIPGKPIEETHSKKYKPGMANLKKQDFCSKCHEMKNPMSGSGIMSVYSEWQQSEAAKKGVTCQNCHMKQGGNGLRYHGFDSGVRNIGIYQDDLAVGDVKLDFPQISLLLENHVTGHSIPASCGTRLLVMELSFRDANGREVHKITEAFTKKTELMADLMPYRVLENSQLQSGEKRRLVYQLPDSLRGQIGEVIITLRFYEVPDEYGGDLKKANWASEVFLRHIVKL